MIRNLVLAAVAVLAIAIPASADKLVVASGQGQLERPNVRVRGIDKGELVFESSGGNESRTALTSIIKIEVTGEATFNNAETAFADKKWDAAASEYTKALRGATKDWMKDRISQRLVDLGKETGKFDVAAAGYVTLVTRNPELAATAKPTLPEDKGATALSTAVSDIDKALSDSKLAADRRMTLLNFKLEIASHRGDEKAVVDTMEQMLKLNPDDPNLQVTVALNSLKNKEYAKALKAIEDNRSRITDADAQANALYIIAESNYQLALAARKTDKTTWQDIAISFMRVVAQFSNSPRAPESLARVASCYEQIQDTKQATEVYKQVVRDYPRSAAAKEAESALARLNKAGT